MMGNTKVPFNEQFAQYEKECVEHFKDQIEDEEDEEHTESKIKMAFFNVTKYHIR
jgi:hypothetical protein